MDNNDDFENSFMGKAKNFLFGKLSINHYDDHIDIIPVKPTTKKIGATILALASWFIVFLYVIFSSPTLILIPILAISAFVTYYSVVCWWNSHHIIVNKNSIEVLHKPLPWFGNRTLAVNDIKRLYIKGKEGQDYEEGRTGDSDFGVYVEMHSGKKIKLVGGFDRKSRALTIEQEIEQFLNISDEEKR